MIKHVCPCGYIYNPEYGDITSDVDPGTKYEDLPEDWACPICGLPKNSFINMNKRIQSEFESLK